MLPASEQVYPLIDYIYIDINCKNLHLRNQNDPRGSSRTTRVLDHLSTSIVLIGIAAACDRRIGP